MSVPPETMRKPASCKALCEDLGVGDSLRGVGAELRAQRFSERHGLGGDDVHERTALLAGEDCLVDGRGEILTADDEAGARATQCLVRGCGGDVRVRHGRRMHAASDEAGDVGHVEDIDRADFVGDLAHAGEVPETRIGAAAADDGLGLFAHGDGFKLVVVDELGVAADLVKGGAIELAAEAEPVAVGKVAAVSEVEAENGVARLQDRGIGRGVGLGAGVGLHVDVVAAEDLFGAVAGQILNDVSVLAAAVVATAGVALGIFVGEDGTGRLQHCFGDEVLAGNHLQPLVLAEGFVVKGGGDVGVGLGEGERHAVSHTGILRHFRMKTSLNKWAGLGGLRLGARPVLFSGTSGLTRGASIF